MVIASSGHSANTFTHKTLVIPKAVTNYHVHPDIHGCVCTFHDLDTVSLGQPVHIFTFLIHLKLAKTMLKERNSKAVFTALKENEIQIQNLAEKAMDLETKFEQTKSDLK